MSDPEEKKTGGHTLADHLYGQNIVHEHDEDSDHDHDHDYDFENDDVPLEDNPLWRQDNVSLMTVGIDIGSSGTQVIFSRVNLRRLAEDLTSRYYVVSRETLFQSPVALTPYQSEERIDDEKLGAIIDDAYNAANLHPDKIDTGVVILTGEALRRENAQGIAKILSEQGGEFVTATAGHHMESMLAAYGSGAARVSSDQAKRILNIDIGGGTTKLGLVENGKVIATAAVHIGGRLQVVEDGKIVRLDPAGKHHAKRAGFAWNRGDAIALADMEKVADGMADALVAAVTARPMPHDIEHLYLTDPIAELGRIDGIMFSGGVSEYVYQREERDFGDMGPRLGRAIRERIAQGAFPWPVLPAGECIRATALGASEYSVQLSGNTSYISAPGVLLPRRNLQVLLPPFVCEDTIDAAKACRRDPQPHDGVRCRSRPRDRAGAALDRHAVLRAARRLRRRHQARARRARRQETAAVHHARRRRGADARPYPARRIARRERDAGDRRRRAMGFRLYRSRPHPHAVLHRAGHHQVAGVQRRPARPAAAAAFAPS